MEFNLLLVLCFLSVSWATSYDTLSMELYWKSKLPNVPIPEAITDMLNHGSLELKDTISGKKFKPACCFYFRYKAAKTKNVPDTNFTNGLLPKTHQITHHQDPALFFFLMQDLQKNMTMELDLTMTTNMPAFLPRNVSESIPFSSDKFPDILKRFSVTPNSFNAMMLKNTIRFCEETPVKGEKKTCATSLESMVDFVKTEVGEDVKVMFTKVMKGKNRLQRYRIGEVVRRVSNNEGAKSVVSCHRMNYVYAVFYCHRVVKTKTYAVRLVGDDGTELETVANCHTETSDWNPDHVAFRVLGVSPGGNPICHFLPQDHIFWYN